MQWWNNAQKTGVARLLAADLANYANRPFSAIPEATQRNLATYGIGEREWGLFRGLDMKAADGRDYLSPSVVEQLTPERLDPMPRANNPGVKDIKGLREAYLDELRTKLGNYYQDSADIAIPTPGAGTGNHEPAHTSRDTTWRSNPYDYAAQGLSYHIRH